MGRPRPASVTAALVLALLMGGCATLSPVERQETSGLAPRASVSAPFFPQELHQCGPAALASILSWSGVHVSPERLAQEVYIPRRKGSLQPELIAASRRHKRIPYVLKPELGAVLREVEAGNPVLALQNLGLSWSPRWHYAVVTGYDLPKQEITLHSGSKRDYVVSMATFARTWERAGSWAVAVLPPSRVPATADEQQYLETILQLEQLGHRRIASTAYASALRRWPDSLPASMGFGNALYAMHDLTGAEQAFRRASIAHPKSAEAFNNLAFVLAQQGRLREAERAATRAVSLGGPHTTNAQDTLQMIHRQLRSTPLPAAATD